MSRGLGDLAFLSDSRTSALVDRDGVVAWYCPLGFDEPSLFAHLLGANGGSWRIGPAGPAEVTRTYLDGTLVLRTEFATASGRFAVTDLLALEPGAEGHEIGKSVPNTLVRIVEALEGRPVVDVEFAPRPEYGLVVPRLRVETGVVRAVAGPLGFRLDTDLPLEDRGDRLTGRAELEAGQAITLALTTWRAHDGDEPPVIDARTLLSGTVASWRSWSDMHEAYEGRSVAEVRRSARVLQGLTDARTGAVVAAATTSLPEVIGGSANWDYRYAWLRDLSFVTRALWIAACPDEADGFLRFTADALGRPDPGRLPIVLGTDGRRDLSERTLEHLAGYRDSRPVRVGNAAWRHRQLDVTGEIVDSAHLMRDAIGTFDPDIRDLLVDLANRAASGWREDDAGMWEARDRERPYTSSKVMCWLALDRALAMADRLGDDPPIDVWRRERDAIRERTLAEAWSSRSEAFGGALGSDELDASVLLMPLVGFIEPHDPRMRSTVHRIRERLTSGPLVHRWDGDDNGFLLTSHWLVECEAMMGERDAAEQRFEALNAMANDVGLLAEMAAPGSHEPIGNLPQAFSHVGLINAASRLTETERSPTA